MITIKKAYKLEKKDMPLKKNSIVYRIYEYGRWHNAEDIDNCRYEITAIKRFRNYVTVYFARKVSERIVLNAKNIQFTKEDINKTIFINRKEAIIMLNKKNKYKRNKYKKTKTT